VAAQPPCWQASSIGFVAGFKAAVLMLVARLAPSLPGFRVLEVSPLWDATTGLFFRAGTFRVTAGFSACFTAETFLVGLACSAATVAQDASINVRHMIVVRMVVVPMFMSAQEPS